VNAVTTTEPTGPVRYVLKAADSVLKVVLAILNFIFL